MIDKIERLVLENVMGNDAVQTGTTSRGSTNKIFVKSTPAQKNLLQLMKLVKAKKTN